MPKKICYQAYKRCKPGGKLIVAVMGRFGVLPHLLKFLTLEQTKKYLSEGWWVEFAPNELGNNINAPLTAHTYTVSELKQLCKSVGWQINTLFGAGILRTLIGQENLIHFIEREGIEAILDMESELAKSTGLLNCAMELGLIAKRPR